MSRIVSPYPSLIGRAETSPEKVLYRGMISRFVESLILHAWGISAPLEFGWWAFAINQQTPATDPRVIVYQTARSRLASLWPGPASVGQLRAFQIIWSGGHCQLRINRQVRGKLTGRLETNPKDGAKPCMQLLFGLQPDEPDDAGQYTVFEWQRADGLSAIIFWDLVQPIVRGHSPAEVEGIIRRTLPPGGPRRRWAGLVKRTSVDEIPSMYWQAAIGATGWRSIASRTLERLETSVRAGEPSRKTNLSSVPLEDAESADSSGGDSVQASPSGREGDDRRIDIERAVGELSQRDQRILRMYGEGYTDEEIGSVLHVSHQAVNKTRQKANLRLRNLLSS